MKTPNWNAKHWRTYTKNRSELDGLRQGTTCWTDELGSTRSLRDYADHYEFDLAGNRIKKTTDFDVNTAAVDQLFYYGFDANDRLRWEQADLDRNGNLSTATDSLNRVTTYGYGNLDRLILTLSPVSLGALDSARNGRFEIGHF